MVGAPLVETRVGPAHTTVGHLLKFDLTDTFPATRAKRLAFGQVARELDCFLKGETSMEQLHAKGVHIWDNDMARAGRNDIGPIYGWQWRHWGASRIDEIRNATHQGFDQLRYAIDELKATGGTSRRAIVSAWNAPEVLSPASVLPPCHVLFQFNMVGWNLYTDVYQRSADAFLGLPFDVASFSILSRLVANELWMSGLKVATETLNYHVANMHLYQAHVEAAEEELANDPSWPPQLYAAGMTVDNFTHKGVKLINYQENRIIKAKLLT